MSEPAADLEGTARLQALSLELIGERDASALYQKIVDAAAAIMRSQFASMQMLHPERGQGGELRLLAFKGFDPHSARFWEWVRADSKCTCGVALSTRQRVIAADVENAAFMAGTEDQRALLAAGIRAAQTTPLVSRQGAVIGMITTHWAQPHQPPEQALRLLDILARQAADLIERARAEEALRASEARYASVLGLMPAAVYTIDAASGVITYFNEHAARLWGRRPALGDTDERFCGSFRLWHPDGTPLPHDRTPMAAAAREGREFRNEEVVIERPDGSRITVMVNIDPLRDAAGRLTGAINVFHDVTERRRAEQRVRESEARLRAIVETTPECVKVVAADGTLLQMNAPGLAMVGAASAEAVLGRCIYDVIAAEHRERFRAFNEAVCRGERGSLEFDIVGLSGVRRNMETHAVPLRQADGALAQLAITRDVTEQRSAASALRSSEERYRALFDAAGVSIWEEDFSAVKELLDRLRESGVADLRRHLAAHPEVVREAIGKVRILDVNDASVRLFGAASKADLMHSLEHVFLLETERVFAEELVALAEGRGHFEAESAMRTLTGARREVFVTVEFPPPGGPFNRVPVTLTDITERKREEEMLREADRRKDEFLAILSHELRNPLAPIRNAVALLQQAEEDATIRRKASEVLGRQTAHLVRLVEDLLDVSRIGRGDITLQRGRAAVSDIVAAALETSRPRVESGGHELRIELPGEALWIDADAVRIAQVISNLINNAAAYTPHGGRIELAARSEDGWFRLSVRDNGVGIAPEAMPALFSMFSRGDVARQHPSGFGIGLALARRLVEMHGGTIEASSGGLGLGAEFTIRLPLAPAEADAARGPEDDRPSTAAPKRVLIVDDNRDAADSLGLVLRHLGAHVRVAHDGRAALEALETEAPSVVILDIGMPGMDGYEVARTICARFPARRPALVALTGWGQEADRRLAREAGFDHHLVKPAEIGALESLLASIR